MIGKKIGKFIADRFNRIRFNTSYVGSDIKEWELRWNDIDGTLDLGMSNGDVTMQVGQEMFTKVRNESGYETISNGQVVYISGRTGVYPDVQKARSDSETTCRVLGVATQDIESPGFGFVTTVGYVRAIKTNYTGAGIWGTTWATGDLLYVSKTDAGVLTNVEPAVPHCSDIVGTVGIVHATLGSILITNEKHYTLERLSDVNGIPLDTDGQFPVWHNTEGYFDFDRNINDYSESDDGTAQGQMMFWDATLGKWTYTETSELFWDDVNKYLGIGDSTPTEKVEINGNIFLNGDNDKALFGTGKDMSIYYDGTNGWIKTDEVAPSDLNISCGTDKTLELQESVWDDIQYVVESGRTSAANFPDWDNLTTNTAAYKFDINDYIDLGAQEMKHDWKEATDIYPHIHTALDGANASGGSYYAKFTLYLSYADGGGVYTETSKDIEIEIPNGTANLTHLFGSSVSVAMTGLTIGTQINMRLKRIAATTGAEYPNHIFVTQVGLHYEVDTMGSRQIWTK